MVYGEAKTQEDLRRVGRAILALLDQMVVLLGLSSSAEKGGGRSPYNPMQKRPKRERERERELLGPVSESGWVPQNSKNI